MTYKAEVLIDPRRTRGRIDPLIYGQMIEHVGRVIYGGVYEPGSPLSDEKGYRLDVIDAVKGMKPTVLRWPGGNFASGYHWMDGVGNTKKRPKRRDVAWGAVEDNLFGTEEFLEYCEILGAEPYLSLNMGTGSVDEALKWLEYCNGTEAGIPEVDLRKKGPHPESHRVKYWGLGNEAPGWWHHGHTSAEHYAEQAREWAKLMRRQDHKARMVAVGASDPDWNWTVLKTAAPYIDYLSLSCYWKAGEDAYTTTLAGPPTSEQDIITAFGMCLGAKKLMGVNRPISLAIDEWGVWSKTAVQTDPSKAVPMEGGFSARSGIDTKFEEPYDLKDALAVASWLHVMWRHPDKVTMATQAQMVNAIAPILTTRAGLVKHTIWWPLAIAREQAGTHSLVLVTRTAAEVEAPGLPGDRISALDAGGTFDPETSQVHLSLVNRSRVEECELSLDMTGTPGPIESTTLWHEDPFAGNTVENPELVTAKRAKIKTPKGMKLVLKPHSHTTVSFPV